MGAIAVFAKGCLSRHIHAGINRSIDKGFLGSLAGFHDRRHGADAEEKREKPRSKRPATVKEDAEKDRQAGHSQTDNGNMIDRQMNVGRSEKLLKHLRSVIQLSFSRKGEAMDYESKEASDSSA